MQSSDPIVWLWLNRDPVEEEGGLNLYAAFGNSPIDRLDPNGTWVPAIIAAYVLWDFACFTAATSMASKAYPETKPPTPGNDKKKHCMTSCVYNKCKLWITPMETIIGGALWEMMPGTSEWKDFMADLEGVLASYKGDCKKQCDKCTLK